MSIDEIVLPEARRAMIRDVVVRSARADLARSKRWRPRVVVAVAAGAVLLPAGVATAYWAFDEPDVRSSARCFSAATLDGRAIWLGTAADAPGVPPPDLDDPVGACADLWRQGILQAGVEDAQPPTPGVDLPVPDLAGCIVEDGGQRYVAVVPGEDTVCADLGLPRWAR